jgi:hypothetical protein
MARKEILRIYDASVFSYVKKHVESSVPSHEVGVHMATPDRPFGFELPVDPETGDIDTNRAASMLITPQVSLTRTGLVYNMQRNNTNKFQKIRYWDAEKNFVVQSEYPRPWDISYLVDVYARLRNDAQNVLQHFLYYTQPLRLVSMDFYYPWGKQKIYLSWNQIIDNSDIESSEKLRYYRYSIPINVESYMFECFDFASDIPHARVGGEPFTSRARTVKSIEVGIKMVDTGETVGTIYASPVTLTLPDGTIVADITYTIESAKRAAKAAQAASENARDIALAARDAAIQAAADAMVTVSSTFSIFAGSTQFIVLSDTNIFIGVSESLNINNAEVPLPAGTIKELLVESTLAPGIGESFTYEVYVNGAGTGITATILGTSTSATVPADLSLNAQDLFVIRLTTSSGSTQTKHKYTVKYTPITTV